MSVVLLCEPLRPESMLYRWDATVSSWERLGEAGWLQDVRTEESIAGQACNQPWPSATCASYLRVPLALALAGCTSSRERAQDFASETCCPTAERAALLAGSSPKLPSWLVSYGR